jgi:ABC-2 type transport system ATP-binding protein
VSNPAPRPGPAPGAPSAPAASVPPSVPTPSIASLSSTVSTLSPLGTVPAAEPAAVAAEGLAFSYGGRVALHGIDFRVEPGEIFGFLGPNGGGKTTLFRLLATLMPPQQGSLRVLGEELFGSGAGGPRQGAAARVRRRLGVVFQAPALDLQLTVRENLVHHGHLYGLRGRDLARRIDRELGRFRLADRAADRALQLSGGLRRRAELAKALLPEPRLLLLDEPSTGLDPGARRDLWSALESLQAEGVTVLLTTHFMEEGDRCGRIALLDGGRIVAEGTPAALKDEIGGDVVTLSGPDPERLAADLAALLPALAPGAPPRTPPSGAEVAVEVRDGAVRLELDRAHERVARLAALLPGRIDAVTVARPTLEDVFLRRTGRRLDAAASEAAEAADVRPDVRPDIRKERR